MMKVLSFVLCACFVYTVLGGGVTLGVNEIPQWDLCVNGGDLFSCSGHGMCSGPDGVCVCTDGYTGRDCSLPPGGFSYPTTLASVTQFCQLETGGCAPGMCVGGGTLDDTSLPPGIDGVAAVNPTLYGSRYAYVNEAGQGSDRTLNGGYSFVGQACGTCWKLTKGAVSIVVSVVDRCAGYCRATPKVGDSPQTCESSAGQGAEECGECIAKGEGSIPQCSCLSPNSTDNAGWCNGYPTAHCDWCANNDHSHFDLDITSQQKICGAEAGNGFCTIDSFQMIACPNLIGTWPNGYYNGSGAPAASSSSSSSSSIASSSSSGSSSSGSNVGVDVTASSCPYTTGDGVCRSVAQGAYVCNGCNLTMCNLGKLYNLGCPLGTVCANGECTFDLPCDPTVSSCTQNSVVTATPTSPPSVIATQPPPIQATTKPTTVPIVITPAPTSPPVIVTSPPSTPAPTLAPNHPCISTRKRSSYPKEEPIVQEQAEVMGSNVETKTQAVSSSSFVVVSFAVVLVALVLHL